MEVPQIGLEIGGGGELARLGEDIFGAQRVAVPGVALHPAERRGGVEGARQAVARQAQPVHQLDEARAAVGRQIGEQRHQPAMAAKLDKQRVGCA